MSKTILVTGANRGLGLEFVRQYAPEQHKIYACCRNLNEAAELIALARQFPHIEVCELDVTSAQQIEQCKKLITHPIDVLINNAGFLNHDDLADVSAEMLEKSFQINTVAPLLLIQAFKDLVAQSQQRLIASISSSMGSIQENGSGGYYSYRASKAALNMIMKSVAIDLAPQKVKVLVLHPGWVKTRMGGEDAMITPEVSVKGMRRVMAEYAPASEEVKFYRYDGGEVAW